MFKAKIQIKKNEIIKDEYFFSDDDKGKLLLCATSWFLGYVRGIADCHVLPNLMQPHVPSLDGYQAWSENGYTIRLLNSEGNIIANENDII